MIPAYKDPDHPSNVIRPRVRCWGCGKRGCVGKRWGNWCFTCDVARIERISAQLAKAGAILNGTGIELH